jgi:iron complex transport system substrate-binding protein
VHELLRAALSIYDLDVDLLAKLDPDLVVTQDLCEVCAVSYDAVCAATDQLIGRPVTMVSLQPQRLDDIWDDIGRVAAALGRPGDGEALLARLRGRLAQVERQAAAAPGRPRVVSIEWLDPVMLGGTWMLELITAAGGTARGDGRAAGANPGPDRPGAPGARGGGGQAVRLPAPADPGRAGAAAAGPALGHLAGSAAGQVYVADGNAYFNRSGPRIVDSAELLAACLHPLQFPGHLAHFREAVRRVDASLTVHDWDR